MTPTNTIATNRLAEAVMAARQGQKAAARRILLEVTADNPGSEQAHLWLAAVSESPEEAVAALERVLLLNPGNRQAVNALAVHRLRVVERERLAGVGPAHVVAQPSAVPAGGGQSNSGPSNGGASNGGPSNGASAGGSSPAFANRIPPAVPHHSQFSAQQPVHSQPNRTNLAGPALASHPGASGVNSPAAHSLNALSDATRTQQAPRQENTHPAPQPQQARKAWVCPVCEGESDRAKAKCPRCGCLIALEDLSALAENRDGNEELLKKAIQGWQARLTEGPSFDAHLSIARAYCNINQSALAVKHLQEAVRLRPHDNNVRRVLDALTARRLVLAVDDSATVRKFVATSLERKGYRVIAAADGVQAIAIAAEVKPDLILLDITMPKIDGYEVCRLIRKTPDIKRTPVVMLSGRDGFFDKMKGKVAGSTDYITKPFDVKTLIAVLERYIVREHRGN